MTDLKEAGRQLYTDKPESQATEPQRQHSNNLEVQKNTVNQEKTLVILAGGKSRRMGRDKTFLPWKNTTFLEHLICRARESFDRILVAAGTREHAEEVRRRLGTKHRVEIIEDLYDSIGPMGGLLSVFEQTRVESFAAVAVDIPEADMKVMEALLSKVRETRSPGDGGYASVMLSINSYSASERADAVVRADTDREADAIGRTNRTKGRTAAEPCAAAWHRRACPWLHASVNRGEYSLRKALEQAPVHVMNEEQIRELCPDISPAELRISFQNINTEQDRGRFSVLFS